MQRLKELLVVYLRLLLIVTHTGIYSSIKECNYSKFSEYLNWQQIANYKLWVNSIKTKVLQA